jgi:hypothetical protein
MNFMRKYYYLCICTSVLIEKNMVFVPAWSFSGNPRAAIYGYDEKC